MLDGEVENNTDMTDLPRRREFMTLPLVERRRIMRRQAEELQQYYKDTTDERSDWQRGDIVEYQSSDESDPR